MPWWYPPIVRPIGSPPCDTHITWPWRPRPAVSCQSFGAASASSGNAPPVLFGAGAGGHPEAPDWRPLGACPYRRQCAECSPPKFIGGLSRTVMGRCRCLLPIGVILRILDWTAMCGGYEGLHRLERPSGRAGALATSAQAMSKDLGVEYRKNLGGLFDMVDGLRHPISWSPRIWSGSCSPVPNV